MRRMRYEGMREDFPSVERNYFEGRVRLRRRRQHNDEDFIHRINYLYCFELISMREGTRSGGKEGKEWGGINDQSSSFEKTEGDCRRGRQCTVIRRRIHKHVNVSIHGIYDRSFCSKRGLCARIISFCSVKVRTVESLPSIVTYL